MAEVLAESRYLVHVDLRENEIRVAGLMALCLALRMNHYLLHLETPKTFKVEQVIIWDRAILASIYVYVSLYVCYTVDQVIRDRAIIASAYVRLCV